MAFWNRNREPLGTGINKKNRNRYRTRKSPSDTHPYLAYRLIIILSNIAVTVILLLLQLFHHLAQLVEFPSYFKTGFHFSLKISLAAQLPVYTP